MKSEVEFYQLKKYWITGKEFELNGEKVTVKVVGLYVDTEKMWSYELSNGEILYRKKPICLCCEKNIPDERPRICPICDHTFKGNGWDGIDSHWRAEHEDIMIYEDFWDSLCPKHKE
ncbi:hypothetical protein [Desulfospira joergensenii]|uniref:hypothetical protein n=1 Tax=Desulfospira joergensenii TaxID=53329 RepID=UPI0003B753C6|nr:hypothetical protein [Desulfospira joergensenii]